MAFNWSAGQPVSGHLPGQPRSFAVPYPHVPPPNLTFIPFGIPPSLPAPGLPISSIPPSLGPPGFPVSCPSPPIALAPATAVMANSGTYIPSRKKNILTIAPDPSEVQTEEQNGQDEDRIYKVFIDMLEVHGPLEQTDQKILNTFIQLSLNERRLVLAQGKIHEFLLKSPLIYLNDDKLTLKTTNSTRSSPVAGKRNELAEMCGITRKSKESPCSFTEEDNSSSSYQSAGSSISSVLKPDVPPFVPKESSRIQSKLSVESPEFKPKYGMPKVQLFGDPLVPYERSYGAHDLNSLSLDVENISSITNFYAVDKDSEDESDSEDLEESAEIRLREKNFCHRGTSPMTMDCFTANKDTQTNLVVASAETNTDISASDPEFAIVTSAGKQDAKANPADQPWNKNAVDEHTSTLLKPTPVESKAVPQPAVDNSGNPSSALTQFGSFQMMQQCWASAFQQYMAMQMFQTFGSAGNMPQPPAGSSTDPMQAMQQMFANMNMGAGMNMPGMPSAGLPFGSAFPAGMGFPFGATPKPPVPQPVHNPLKEFLERESIAGQNKAMGDAPAAGKEVDPLKEYLKKESLFTPVMSGKDVGRSASRASASSSPSSIQLGMKGEVTITNGSSESLECRQSGNFKECNLEENQENLCKRGSLDSPSLFKTVSVEDEWMSRSSSQESELAGKKPKTLNVAKLVSGVELKKSAGPAGAIRIRKNKAKISESDSGSVVLPKTTVPPGFTQDMLEVPPGFDFNNLPDKPVGGGAKINTGNFIDAKSEVGKAEKRQEAGDADSLAKNVANHVDFMPTFLQKPSPAAVSFSTTDVSRNVPATASFSFAGVHGKPVALPRNENLPFAGYFQPKDKEESKPVSSTVPPLMSFNPFSSSHIPSKLLESKDWKPITAERKGPSRMNVNVANFMPAPANTLQPMVATPPPAPTLSAPKLFEDWDTEVTGEARPTMKFTWQSNRIETTSKPTLPKTGVTGAASASYAKAASVESAGKVAATDTESVNTMVTLKPQTRLKEMAPKDLDPWTDSADGGEWQTVGKSRKRERSHNSQSGLPGNLDFANGAGFEGEEKKTSFQQLLGKVESMFPNCPRQKILDALKRIREERGALKGLSVKALMTHMEDILFNGADGKKSSTRIGGERKTSVAEDDACAICLDLHNFDTVSLDCGHRFHKGCIEPWLKERAMTCPTCRKHVYLQEDFPALGS